MFEDEEEGDVWQHEQRLAREPPQGLLQLQICVQQQSYHCG